MNNTPVSSKENQGLEVLQFTLQRQDDQSKVMQEVITAVIEVRDEMVEMRDETKKQFELMKDENKITRRQSGKLKSVVGKQAAKLTNALFGKKVSNELFSKKAGHLTRGIYTKLGIRYDVSSYLDIRSIDFEKAKDFVESLELSDFETYQLRITDKQAETALKHGDDISFLLEEPK